ncbi:methylated-DNA--[protein]-cysteine S-methyltransferase [Aminipila butyrica]|uniref:Methylated-DNA--protein-cysteine methyltransferase n=2 Tax=Aminipila butyrica TaxID=433296 RepID=A0A858C0Y2_9FIRM|nr:methylated-DNA--[protein]-cysteine S-methyltransferase [Aminipila butyrica]
MNGKKASKVYYKMDYESPLGRLTLASDGDALVGLWLPGQKYFEATVTGAVTKTKELSVFRVVKAWLDRYFAGEEPDISSLSLAPEGTPFRQEVWKILCQIPYGETITYGEIARQVAEKMDKPGMSPQAVGGAVGHNPISIIIPCHRVVGTDGRLTGYAGGIPAKVWLLKNEKVDLRRLTNPANRFMNF